MIFKSLSRKVKKFAIFMKYYFTLQKNPTIINTKISILLKIFDNKIMDIILRNYFIEKIINFSIWI